MYYKRILDKNRFHAGLRNKKSCCRKYSKNP